MLAAVVRGEGTAVVRGVTPQEVFDFVLDPAQYTKADTKVLWVTKLADTPTRLNSIPADLQERLINWGYAVCDAAMRKHVGQDLPAPSGFPYPRVGVG